MRSVYEWTMAVALLAVAPLSVGRSPQQPIPVDLNDPRVGNPAGRVNTVIGPTLRHGSIHFSPGTMDGGTSGDKLARPIRGFGQRRAGGTGWATYGDLLLSPQVGLGVRQDGHDSPVADEATTPCAYRVRLTRDDVDVHSSPTRNAAFHRSTLPAYDRAHLSLDLIDQIPKQMIEHQNGRVVASRSEVVPDGRVRDSFVAGGTGKVSSADQGGDDGENIIADAFVKELKGVDRAAIHCVLLHDAERERRGAAEPRDDAAGGRRA